MKKDFTRLDNLLKKFADTGSVPGCSCTIMQNDEIIYEGYAGYSDIEAKKPVDRNSMYSQASTTKLFTYAIMGMLYEEGEFLFSDPVSDYLPEYKDTKKVVMNPNGTFDLVPLDKPMTIRDAVAMMCGMPYCFSPVPNAVGNPTLSFMSEAIAELQQEKGTPTTLRDEVRAIAKAPIMFEPATHWQYGSGSEITGAIVETITGKYVREVMKERIIDPLELEHTDTYIRPTNEDLVVKTYLKKDGKLSPAPGYGSEARPETLPAAARPNLFTSSNDFAVFMQMLANGGVYKGKKFLGQGTVDMLHTNVLNETQIADFTNDYLAGYGYGYGFRTLMTQAYGHNGRLGSFGWTGGSGIWSEANPVDKMSVVYMHNMMPNEELYHHHRVRAVAYGCAL